MVQTVSEAPLMTEEKLDQVSEAGRAIYEARLKPLLEPEFNGQEVAIHIDTGDYEVGKRSKRPGIALADRHPEGGMILITDVGPPRPGDTLTVRMSGQYFAMKP
jgi:hypothetical protein